MRKYYTFIDEHHIEEYTKPYVVVNGRQISYPSAEVLLSAEKKPLVVDEVPEHNENTQYVDFYYVDGETEITQKWNVYDYPEDEVIDYEIADA